MKRKIKSSQKGAISVFVMITMVFFLLTILGVYMISSKRAQTQTESVKLVQGQYYEENEENVLYHSKIADNSAIIPIYTKEQLWSIGTGKAIEMEGKVYTFSSSANYELKNDIIINIEGLEGSNTIDETKLNKNHYEIYYYYNQDYYVPTTAANSKLSINGNYYAYKNLSKDLGYVTDGLVVHYDGIKNTAMGHNTSSTTWKDLSGNGNDGTLIGGTWNENCLRCSENNDQVNPIPVKEMSTDNLSIEMIFSDDNLSGNSTPLLASVNQWNSFHSHTWTGNVLYIGGNAIQDGDNARITPTDMGNLKIEKNKIYHMCYTYNGSSKEAKLYINGNKVATKTYTVSPKDSEYFVIYGEPKRVYNLMIYKSVLTDTQIQQNYEIDKLRFGVE